MEIKSLGNTDFNTIFEAFQQAFAGYEVQLNRAQLRSMFNRRGFNASLSFAAFDAGRIVAFTCNGIGDFEGVPTAYDTGTGTLEEYRGQGLATRIFEHSLPHLGRQGIRQYLLEALQHNTKAVSVYRKIGFETRREFYYFIQQSNQIRNEIKTPAVPLDIKPIDIEQYRQTADFWDFHPSWQNSLASVRRAPEDFVCFGAFADDRLAGYGIFEPASGDITQIAVDRNHRRQGIGSLLLQKMLETNQCGSVKAINADVACDSFQGFMKAKNIVLRGKQFEMLKPI